jgi:hypothetical protein
MITLTSGKRLTSTERMDIPTRSGFVLRAEMIVGLRRLSGEAALAPETSASKTTIATATMRNARSRLRASTVRDLACPKLVRFVRVVIGVILRMTTEIPESLQAMPRASPADFKIKWKTVRERRVAKLKSPVRRQNANPMRMPGTIISFSS